MSLRRFLKDQEGAAALEMAFALPVVMIAIWTMVQYAAVFRASAGIQHALGEGARVGTVWSEDGVSLSAIRNTVNAAVYGIGPGTFSPPLVVAGTDCSSRCIDVTVHYTQETDLLFLPGPTISVRRSKRVWASGAIVA